MSSRQGVSDWTGETAVIVASGPTAAETPIYLARDKAKVIVVKDSWRLAPWADILYGCDGTWWCHHNGVTEFKGQRFTSSPSAAKKFNIDLFISNGTNSGLRAIYLAERLNASRILLVGFDMHDRRGTHWHGQSMRNPGQREMQIWLDEMNRVACRLTNVINCSPDTALTCFPFQSFAKAIEIGNTNSPPADRQGHFAIP